jgi:hypothetical protein
MTGQKQILTELKSSWPVILTGDLLYLPLFWALEEQTTKLRDVSIPFV